MMKILSVIFQDQIPYEFIYDFDWKKWGSMIIFVIVKLVLFSMSLFILEILFNRIIHYIEKKAISSNFVWKRILYENKVFDSLSHFFPLLIGFLLINPLFKKNTPVVFCLDRIFNILFVLIVLQFLIRLVNSIIKIATNENNHQTIAIRTISQLLKIMSILLCSLMIISILTRTQLITILTSLGAITAFVILVFRDVILGFVSGVQISFTKMIKVGDWIGIQKYHVEGTVIEINLTSAKIENFDKTITNVPTYDLISTAVTNFEEMRKKNMRRIKRSILFSIPSFHFCNEENLKKFKNVFLIKNYIEKKQKEINFFNKKKNIDDKNTNLNGKRITNIELFRQYAWEYLNHHPKILKKEILMVRYLEPNHYGLPIELYCFVKTSESIKYEQIQSNILDHLLTAAKEFNLEITQVLNEKKY
ncbi:mechanosensitive ion channel family protein [Blattabacterium cuenoti]|uniref:mechanosensitive ion channel family protein n=1 Tax=Blattabacterium cuenoti TaxID=1653831 RepID=UPI001CC22AB9|nr:mechanosensitive ion channel domain-containing protein [Blattabacterium cuenoti]